ncbi:MAG TPA: nuclear transport factor 2 family protein [Baekduia sp.]|uniref:nuclear transport factor 2 family protein n=1 Tax=Baekduia sp. TaxID=2600305 RepID=UPI002D7752BF|nr:nuclear transport factor 2 family protein [Baekduia sp.]HET6509975.1 nuclear transport factor 2 family protein [Baekduia sp.]
MPDQGEQVIRDYIAAQESLDADRIVAFLADDAVLEFPYALPGMAARVDGGPEALREHAGQIPQFMRSFTYSEVVVHPLAAAGRYFVEVRVDGVLTNPAAPPYRNRYAILAEVSGEQVTFWREYFGATEVGGLLAGMAA